MSRKLVQKAVLETVDSSTALRESELTCGDAGLRSRNDWVFVVEREVFPFSAQCLKALSMVVTTKPTAYRLVKILCSNPCKKDDEGGRGVTRRGLVVPVWDV